MDAPKDTPERAAKAEPADLGRLRIARGADDVARVRGFPWIRVFLGVGVLLLLFLFRGPLLGLVGSSGAATVRTARALKVVPGQAEQGDVAANGYIVADKQASLASVISGRLVELNAAEGDTVEENTVVARIQSDDLEAREAQALAGQAAAQARLEEVRANVASANARVLEAESEWKAAGLSSARLEAEQAAQAEMVALAEETAARMEREVERNRSLFEKKKIDSGTWDRIQTEAREALKALEAARARERATEAATAAWAAQVERRAQSLAVAKAAALGASKAEAVAASAVTEAEALARFAAIELEKTRIRAPFRGLVIRKDAEVGEVIAPTGAGNSRGSVLTIVDPASLEVQVELSERRIGSVAEGHRAVVFLDAAPDQGMPATVRKIWPRADRSKGSIEVRVKLDAIPPTLRPEMAARVVFKGPRQPEADEAGEAFVTVPRAAVTKRAGKDVVFVVSGGVARLRALTLGEARGEAVVVTAGLEGGESVILDPAADLVDGSRVTKEP